MALNLAASAGRAIRRAAGPVLAAVVLVFVGFRLHALDWPAVAGAVTDHGTRGVLAAAAIALPGIAAVTLYDLIGRHATAHAIAIRRTMLISFCGYFFSLNLGALLGGLAMRYRLYMPYRLGPTKIGQIIVLSVLTNWSGFALVAGAVLTVAPPAMEGAIGIASSTLRVIGILLVLATVAYLVICACRGGTLVRIRDTRVRLPSLTIAWLQIGLSAVNWASIGAVIAWLLPDVGWVAVMPVLMVSAIAGIWSHVPGGLGVTEAVFLTLLAERASEPELLAAIVLFRVVYYFLPLVAALFGYAYLELEARSSG
jgi:uncharacterized membrane protein YbhN (UPF0104 family)